MADIHITIPEDTISISSHTVDRLLRASDGDAALLYLYLLRSHGKTTVKQSAAAIGKSENTVVASMRLLSRLGLVGSTEAEKLPCPAPAEETPQYTAEDIAREMENGSVFPALVQEVQRSLDKILSSVDLMKLFGIYDNLSLPPEVILQLVNHCIEEVGRGKPEYHKKPSMGYIEKAAYTWEREGITSIEDAERYLKRLEARRDLSGRIKSALQINDREFSVSEKRYVEGWIDMGFSPEAIGEAYDRTVVKTGKRSWAYMNSILKSWHEKGIHTVSDINERDGRRKAEHTSAGPHRYEEKAYGGTIPQTGTEDMERMKKLLQKLKEGGNVS